MLVHLLHKKQQQKSKAGKFFKKGFVFRRGGGFLIGTTPSVRYHQQCLIVVERMIEPSLQLLTRNGIGTKPIS